MSEPSALHSSGTTATISGASLALESLCKSFGAVDAVSDVSFDIQAGEFVTLLGPSGSGKTTVLKMIAGFEYPTSGHIRISGKAVEDLDPGQRNLGMVFQNYALFPHMTVSENIAYGLKFRKLSKKQSGAKVDEMLDLVQMTSFRERHPRELSGGQQQRIALARSLAIEPRLLLMDEPLGALDRSLRIEMSTQIKKLHRETGTTFLYVTHDQEEALVLSDRVAIMKDARLVACDTAENLYNTPPDAFTAEFFGNCNKVAAAHFEVIPDSHGGHREYYFHQEHVRVVQDAEVAGGFRASGTVSELMFMGSSYQLMIELDPRCTISARLFDVDTETLPRVGERVSVGVEAENIHGFSH